MKGAITQMKIIYALLIGYLAGAWSLIVLWAFYRKRINTRIEKLKEAARIAQGE